MCATARLNTIDDELAFPHRDRADPLTPRPRASGLPVGSRGQIGQPAMLPDARMKHRIARAAVEVGFIVFLFYANLLMGEYERSGMGRTRGLAWAVDDILTAQNLAIAVVSALIGHGIFEFLRKKLP